jgi:AAA+ ATPase superfamily predicted ATPase
MNLIGREKERQMLLDSYGSGKPEFVAVYGRRRVGKTFLVKEQFRGELAFYTTGIMNSTARRQLQTFMDSLREYSGEDYPAAKDWFDAFKHLKTHLRALIEKQPGKRLLVFIDEIPWLDTAKSEFVSALDYFWNSFASSHPEIMLIACGSAASWMVKKLLQNTGGLHNRVTRRIALKPFSLAECKLFCAAKGLVLSNYQIIEIYMVLGGIPFYLDLLSSRKSPVQNINDLCFSADGELANEFQMLYSSLFSKPERHMRVIEALASKNRGLSNNEIVAATGLAKGGTLSQILTELELSGFIRPYHPYERIKRGRLYQLIDPFTSFYFNFLVGKRATDNNFWLHALNSGGRNAWSGYAFEQVCITHTEQIKASLGIAGVTSDISSWRSTASNPGAQVDLIIDRNDGVINLCEIKYSNAEFAINRAYDQVLRERKATFVRETKTRKAVHTTFVTVYGLKKNEFSANVQSEVLADDLFR